MIKLKFPALFVLFCALALAPRMAAQTASLLGTVMDPSGAVVPGAAITVSSSTQTLHTISGADGHYAFRRLAAGSYSINAEATGFAPFSLPVVSLAAGKEKVLNLSLVIAVEKQEVTVEGQSQSVGISPEQNAGAIVLKGGDLNALSDDPNELQNELQALAGPAAGPNGGQIYIDGFEGGQIPPKSSILEVRVNQNPFSAEYDRMGYGRIEIITKPGGQKLKGSISGFGNSSALNTANPFIAEQPSYYMYGMFGNFSGPFSKTATWFFSANRFDNENQTIVNALNPQNTAQNIAESFPTPNTNFSIGPRLDFQLGKSNMMTVRESFYRFTQVGSGVGTLNLPEQAVNSKSIYNELQAGDTIIVSPRLLSEVHVLWDRTSTRQTPSSLAPSVTVQGAFTTGGSSAGASSNRLDQFAVQDYWTATAGSHTLRFGARLRAYRDANSTTAGSNGSYFFSNVAEYLAGTPTQYSATVITNPVARALVIDGSMFLQDDWHWKPNLMIGLGIRYEGQNYIHDHADWAPRIAIAWSPGHPGKARPKTVVRAGYGWFYNRFTVPSVFNGSAPPYILQTIHDNLINQKSYVVANPTFYDPSAAEPPSALAGLSSSVPSYHTIDSHFHAALDMQGGIGIDRQITKRITSNVTYLYTQGVHQYLSNNVTAPDFNVATYSATGAAPSVYNYQYQSGGFYRQNQFIVSSSVQLKHLTLSGNYTLNYAKSDTQGVNSFPSVAQNPGLDYGRASFGIRHRLTFLESYTMPHGIVIASLLAAQSGTPYNLTIGNDLTGNNQFNARPTYGTCGDAGVVTTQYGCLDTDPAGKDERIVPYGVGMGPANMVYHLRISKVIGIGPRIKTAGEGQMYHSGNNGLSGGGGTALRLDAAAPRKYNLTFVAGANNLFNIVNLGTPNGVLLSPLFNKTQSLAGGQFGNPTPGNRTIFLQSTFSF
ncbi:MAG TPA: carboxypeptidase regulatory-like domain-containing protein [Terracidiphilus sp.]|nr:carboxypeptidase regulatory-like domain-containing protein [Terracidiphilus sp.]HUX28505.1 carboxypeptidase regulatory-like domain-containing protein [Terracidiphilus sp.]